MKNLTFKPKQVTKKLLAILPERAREVLVKRYGLGSSVHRETLEAIGDSYGITRERVRQIENYALSSIRRHSVYGECKAVFDELFEAVDTLGGIVPEEDLLTYLGKDEEFRNHVHFLLVVGDVFFKERENDEFVHRWHIDQPLAEEVHRSLRALYSNLSDSDLVPESDLIDAFLMELKNVNQKYRNEEVLRRWLSLSKRIGANPLGEWGKAESPSVRVKGMRDFAYLAIRRHGSPMHFREVAQTIGDLFKRKAHEATCHNELIKDSRFVLVGRGMYALKEWGYEGGAVKDVIENILRTKGPLTREEIINEVKKERYVKDNTIVINLQNGTYFSKAADGTYSLVS